MADESSDQQLRDPETFYASPRNADGKALRIAPDRFITLQKSDTYPSISLYRVDDRKAGQNWRKDEGTIVFLYKSINQSINQTQHQSFTMFSS